MAAKELSYISLFLVIFIAFSNGLSSSLEDIAKCRSVCNRTYALHTYKTGKHYEACIHGCFGAARENMWRRFRFPVERNCSQECKVRFASGSYYACQTGCSWGKNMEIHQTVETNPTESHQEQHSTVAGMILHPVMLLRTYGRGMINRLTYYIQSSTSYYFRSENGGLVVVNIQDQPRIIVSSKDPNAWNNEIDVPEKQSDENTNGKYGEQYESWIIVRRGHHWLNCVSHKSGIPMWILSSILFLSSFFLLWLCCAATLSSSSSKKSCRKPKKAFLIREFLSERKAKDDVPLLSLDENEAQAGSLPSK